MDAPPPHGTPSRPRNPYRFRVSGPASATPRCAGQQVRPRPCRAGPGSRLDTTLRGAGRHRGDGPDRDALGTLRRAQPAAGRGSTRGGGTDARATGSAHVDGVKARRARAAAPSPPGRVPAGRDGAGAPPDRERRPTKPETSPGPAAGRVRPCRAAPRSRLQAAPRDGPAPGAPPPAPESARRPTRPPGRLIGRIL